MQSTGAKLSDNDNPTVVVSVPDLGLRHEERAEVLVWHVRQGGKLDCDEELVDLAVDKAVFTLTAPCAGRLAEIVVAAGAAASQDEVLCRIRQVGKTVTSRRAEGE